jgi:hypothetical protein
MGSCLKEYFNFNYFVQFRRVTPVVLSTWASSTKIGSLEAHGKLDGRGYMVHFNGRGYIVSLIAGGTVSDRWGYMAN